MIADVDVPDEVRAAEDWLSANREALTHAVEEGGCGCCIRSWRLEGPAAVLATIPPEVSARDPNWDSE
jgi:hypothetical protein